MNSQAKGSPMARKIYSKMPRIRTLYTYNRKLSIFRVEFFIEKYL